MRAPPEQKPAIQTMQDAGGTVVERTGALRLVTMARTCAESASEQIAYVEAHLGRLTG